MKLKVKFDLISFSCVIGDGVLLPSMWDSHVSGVHMWRTWRTSHCASEGRRGAAQSLATGAAECCQKEVRRELGLLRVSFLKLKIPMNPAPPSLIWLKPTWEPLFPLQVAGDRLGPADAVRYSAAADQSEELHRGGHPQHLWRAAEDAQRPQECFTDGAGGQLWHQTEGEEHETSLLDF